MSRAVEGAAGDLLEALGMVVLNFSSLEESLRAAILVLALTECPAGDRPVNVLTARLPFQTLVDTFGALCKELGIARLPDDVEPFCKYLGAVNTDRNTLIHSVWNLRTEGPPRRFKRTAKPKTGFRLKVTETNVTEVLAFAFEISEAERKLWDLVP